MGALGIRGNGDTTVIEAQRTTWTWLYESCLLNPIQRILGSLSAILSQVEKGHCMKFGEVDISFNLLFGNI